uniref:VP2 n=1 Tax=Wenling rattails calicivirus 3 TaxID=2116390 RepID=A0A2P1GN26_9CALI|nr:VP2 [Wenling rattails calicivirus 3]
MFGSAVTSALGGALGGLSGVAGGVAGQALANKGAWDRQLESQAYNSSLLSRRDSALAGAGLSSAAGYLGGGSGQSGTMLWNATVAPNLVQFGAGGFMGSPILAGTRKPGTARTSNTSPATTRFHGSQISVNQNKMYDTAGVYNWAAGLPRGNFSHNNQSISGAGSSVLSQGAAENRIINSVLTMKPPGSTSYSL